VIPVAYADDLVTAHIAVAVQLPPDVRDVSLTARQATEAAPVVFVDDGSFSFDYAGDGEWWALLNPQPGANALAIAGTIAGAPVRHTEIVTVPAAYQATTYEVTLQASEGAEGWALARIFPTDLPAIGGPTGVGLAGEAEAAGLSPAALYLGWGAFCLALVVAAIVRASVLRAGRR
jgi:hypothetical protein